MRYLFFGLLFEAKYEQKMLALSKRGTQQQVNQFQFNIINGFEQVINKKIDILSSVPLGAYPKNCRSIKIRNSDFEGSGNIKYIGFRNIGYLRNIDRVKEYYRLASEYIEASDEKCTLMIYSLYLPFLQVNKRLKEKYKEKITTVLIVPDLVGKYAISPRNLIRKILYNYQSKKQFQLQKNADFYVLFTEAMKIPLEIGNKPYVVIEGIAPEVEPYSISNIQDKKIILYTGTLSKETGIYDLIEAFSGIKDSTYRLYIAGSGMDAEYVKREAEKDSRIKFFGYVDRKKIRELQEQCSVLVNARTDSLEYTKYSFPSKTMEYLMTGKPVVMHKLSGVPEEYSEYLFLTKEQTADGLREALIKACSISNEELKNRAERVVKWMNENKTSVAQCIKLKRGLEEYFSKNNLF